MTPPINIDGTNENYSNVTIDGQDVEQITIDGQDVLSAIPDSVVDNFEDGDTTVPVGNWSGWSGDTSSLTAQQSTVLNGNFSGELATDDNAAVTAVRDSAYEIEEMSVVVRVDALAAQKSDGLFIRLVDISNQILEFEMRYDGSIQINAQPVSGSWSANTTYRVRIHNIDFSNETFDAEFIRYSDGVVLENYNGNSFSNSASDADTIEIINNTNQNSVNPTVIFDDVKAIPR